MTEQEYKDQKTKMADDYAKAVRDLEMEYCLSKTPYSVGDIVQDHYGAVLLTEIFYVNHQLCNYDNVSLVFKGLDLKKSDLTPKKNGSVREVFETNIEKILKKNEQEWIEK